MYTLRQISPDDSVSGLSLGDEAFVPLKTFLARYAKVYHRKHPVMFVDIGRLA